MGFRHAITTVCLNAGFCIAKQADRNSIRHLIRRLHPVVTDIPLVRLGADGDGGYLVPDDLRDVAACFSPGVDNRATFESAMIERGVPCFLADRSVDGPPFDHSMITFEHKFLGAVDDESTLTLDRWVADSAPGNHDLVLQMDIEGAEWIVLLNASPDTLRRFRIIVTEVHDLERLLDKHAFPVIEAAFSRLLHDFHLVHNHPNNSGRSVRIGDLVIPRVMEMTWLRKDRAAANGWARQFPHPLDIVNDSDSTDVVLPAVWFGSPQPPAARQVPDSRGALAWGRHAGVRRTQ